MIQFPNYVEQELDEVARKLVQVFSKTPVWCFHAEMGTGKTTLIKKVGQELGVVDTMSSPTFSIVNEYTTKTEQTIYHFDCYRLKSLEDAFNAGVEEYLHSGNLCLIEWPELIAPMLPDEYVEINITLAGRISRSLIAQMK